MKGTDYNQNTFCELLKSNTEGIFIWLDKQII